MVSPLYIDKPRFTPSPYGLLSCVEFPPVGDTHWKGGVTYQPMCVPAGGVFSSYDECIAITGTGGAPPPPQYTSNAVDASTRMATPFSVALEYDCALIGRNIDEDAAAMAAFGTVEGYQVERSFWTGQAGGAPIVYPHLAAASAQVWTQPTTTAGPITIQPAAVIISGVGGGVNVATGLGVLEGALAECYGGIGVIHVPQLAAATFDAYGLLKKAGSHYETSAGNKVAIGSGYPGTAPSGANRLATECWIYATGNVFCLREDAAQTRGRTGVNQFDRVKNTQKIIVERRYLLGFDCCLLAVNIALGAPKGN